MITVGALGEIEFLIIGFGLKTDYKFVGLAISAIIVYIVALGVAFGNEKHKGLWDSFDRVLGPILSRFYGILGYILLSNYYGILRFALLLSAGMIALSEKETTYWNCSASQSLTACNLNYKSGTQSSYAAFNFLNTLR